MIRLTCITNDEAPASFHIEHGFAVWIESDHGNILFDTGSSSEALLYNMQQLDLNPAKIDAVILSHAHDDHTGGLEGLIPYLKPNTPLYANATLFRNRYSNHGDGPLYRGIKLSQGELAQHMALHLSDDPQEVMPGIWTTGAITNRPEPEGRSARHTIIEESQHIPDPYSDDLSLVIESSDALFLLCGCCHAGLLNTIYHIQTRWDKPISGLGGGTHLKGATEETMARTISKVLAMENLRLVWLAHCSGEDFIEKMGEALEPERFKHGLAGDVIRICNGLPTLMES
ncbi:MAG: MBL fold metallo-hydrolase [Anaerolineae bacterium]|nr:MBL fold metallo-hydrolase [Anaerolineae bacterium]